jgi:antitoxin MazE
MWSQPMKVKVTKWGNSLGVRLPKSAAETAGVSAGTELDLTVEGGGFRLRSMKKTSAQRLEELLDQIDPNNVPEMVDWGPDRGAEIIDDDYSRGLIVPGPDGSPVRTDGPSSERQAGKRDVSPRRR